MIHAVISPCGDRRLAVSTVAEHARALAAERRNMRWPLQRHVVPAIGHLTVPELTDDPRPLRDLLIRLTRSRAPSTVGGVRWAIRAIWARASDLGEEYRACPLPRLRGRRTTDLEVAGAKLPRMPLTPHEAARLLERSAVARRMGRLVAAGRVRRAHRKAPWMRSGGEP